MKNYHGKHRLSVRSGMAIGGIAIFLLAALALRVLSGQIPPRLQIQEPKPPRIVSFKINNGAERADPNGYLTLNNVIEGQASEYRASLNDSTFSGRAWSTYRTAPDFYVTLPIDRIVDTLVTIYFQVRFKASSVLEKVRYLESSPTYDTIIIPRNPPQEYKFGAGEAYIWAKSKGWQFSCTTDHILARCYIQGDDYALGGLHLITKGNPYELFGATSDYTLFAGKELVAGWKFKSLTRNVTSCQGTGLRHDFNQWPAQNSSNITIKIHTWADFNHICEVILQTFTLEGPQSLEGWRAAFR